MKTLNWTSKFTNCSQAHLKNRETKESPAYVLTFIRLRCFRNACFLFLSCCVLLSSCYTARLYAPHSQVVPGFTDKQQGFVSIAAIKNNEDDYIYYDYDYGSSTRGISLQAAYAPINHLGLTLNYARTKGDDDFKQFEAGIGYFFSPSEKISLEAYAGFGNGEAHSGEEFNFSSKTYTSSDSTEYYNDYINSYVEGDITQKRWFLQPSATFKISEYFEIAMGLKYSRVDFRDLTIRKGLIPTEDYDEDVAEAMRQVDNAKAIEAHGRYAMVEPCITLRGGLKNLKGQIQFGFASTTDDTLRKMMYSSFTSVGITYAFNLKSLKR